MQAKLISLDGGTPILLKRDVTVVGRKRDICDVYLDRHSVSKLHCLIVKTDGLLFVRDLGSTNGTKVNGERVTRGALLPGDELAFAKAKFRVHLGPDDAASSPPPATEVLSAISKPKRDKPERFADPDSVSDVVPLKEIDSDRDSNIRMLLDDPDT